MRFIHDQILIDWFKSSCISEKSFEWDRGNTTKSLKHGVKKEEMMELFSFPFILGRKIIEPFHPEDRWILFGSSENGRGLSLIFTVRDGLIRPISCRPMRKEEKIIYEEEINR
jgi:uncharacterized DUF497 family protein